MKGKEVWEVKRERGVKEGRAERKNELRTEGRRDLKEERNERKKGRKMKGRKCGKINIK